jgi:GNAT superfamily N-acetyltransferase
MQIHLKPVADSELNEFLGIFQPRYIEERMHSDLLSHGESRVFVERQWKTLLPEGTRSPGHYFLWAVDQTEDARIGLLWLFFDASIHQTFIYQIEVFGPRQRRGYGRQLLKEAECFARKLGARAMSLNVFSTNKKAISLYGSSGYTTVSQNMTKAIDA